MSTTMIRRYSQLRRYDTFMDRFEYLKLGGGVGESTFGFDRYLNQKFYQSREWKWARDEVIVRDNGCDLGVPGYDIPEAGLLVVHHINPMSVEDIVHNEEWILDPEYLVCCSDATHRAIHYGNLDYLQVEFVERTPGDTTLW